MLVLLTLDWIIHPNAYICTSTNTQNIAVRIFADAPNTARFGFYDDDEGLIFVR